jgi:hypothetical protein
MEARDSCGYKWPNGIDLVSDIFLHRCVKTMYNIANIFSLLFFIKEKVGL